MTPEMKPSRLPCLMKGQQSPRLRSQVCGSLIPQLLDSLAVCVCELQVLHSVHERASHEELRAEVVDKLWVLLAAQAQPRRQRCISRSSYYDVLVLLDSPPQLPLLHSAPTRMSCGKSAHCLLIDFQVLLAAQRHNRLVQMRLQ